MRRNRPALPLGVIVGGSVLVGGLLIVTATSVALLLGGSGSPTSVGVGVGVGLAGSVAAAVFATAGAERFARRLRVLRAVALRDAADERIDLGESTGIACSEMNELVRTIEALTLRARVADQVSERHRRNAETASAGMFELLSGLVAAEEGARGQLAAELHDTVAQSLALARSFLASGDPAAVDKAAEYANDAEEQVRAVMARTRPPALRDGDLAGAVAALRDELMQRYGLEVQISWPAVAHPLPLVTAITIYRFFQEALLNVVKHADVDAAEARLEVDEESVVARVIDHGPGFDPEQVKPQMGRHVGLGLLRERARLAGGSLEVSSMTEEGTMLVLRLPRAPVAGFADAPDGSGDAEAGAQPQLEPRSAPASR